jgi:hypothetical protein
MTLRSLFAALALTTIGLAVLPAWGSEPAPFELVTSAESLREQQAARQQPEAPRTRSMPVPRPAGPVIRVLAPNLSDAVTPPLRIELAFEPTAGARIVPESFRLLYGVLKIDLTERLRRHATVTERGVLIDRAQVPNGLHRLFMQIADDQGNQTEQELRVRVGLPS